MKQIKNSKGITLVELLTVLAVSGMVATLAYTILFQGYANYERTRAETQLRDEADLLMANFIKELFVLKASEIELSEACKSGSPDSYLTVTPDDGSAPYRTGFINGQVLVGGKPVRFYDEAVELVPNACGSTPALHQSITENGAEYTIRFTLTTDYRGGERQMEFVNTVRVIDDSSLTAGP